MSCKRISTVLVGIALIPASLLLSSCSKGTDEARSTESAPRVESAPAPVSKILPLASPTPTADATQKSSAPPSTAEIQAAVARVFEKAATPNSAEGSFAVGDFNGDGSEDLAVAVKATEGALGEINNEMANWTLEDPRSVPTASTVRTSRGKPVRAEKGDSLLAIIHGIGAQGWRAPEAKQTFVLKNAAGSRVLAQSPKNLRGTTQKLPPLRGDILNEMISGKSGFLFWTGAKYAWWKVN
jgi:hypothetical protein